MKKILIALITITSSLSAATYASDNGVKGGKDATVVDVAVSNDAFGKLPAATVDGLLKVEAKETFSAVLTYRIVAGVFRAADVVNAIQKNNGKFEIKTVQGCALVASLHDGKVILTDSVGNASTLIRVDVKASNGIIHAVYSEGMPELSRVFSNDILSLP